MSRRFAQLQALKELHQVVAGAEATALEVGRLEPGERLLLHFQISLGVFAVCGVRALVA
jgi:hypothetical protein